MRFIILLLFPLSLLAQNYGFKIDTDIEVKVENKTLKNAWAGGLNSPQFSKMHLNSDAIEDLVVFDRSTSRVLTFVAAAQVNGYFWKYESRYEHLFPTDLAHWILLVDYDRDGRKDLFTTTTAGIRVFKNVMSSNGFAWQLVIDPIRTEGFSGNINLYVQATDLPAISDMDDDGDVDIMAFDFSGNTLEYHQNLSIENGSKKPFEFRKAATCWGRFVKEHCNDFKFDQPCELVSGNAARVMHAGNAVWVGDLNGDGRKDLLHGHITCTNLAKLNNIGSNGVAARMGSFDKDFPAVVPVNFKVFPSPYIEDVTFDGRPDLIASPSVYYNENNVVNMRQSAWLYRNDGTATNPIFTWQQNDFLQADMLDLGENSAPTLADYDGDGDLDLWVGYSGRATDKGYRAGLWFFENKGTTQKAVFELVSSDFMNLSQQFQITESKPFFADLDQNGTTDLGFYGFGINGMEIRYIPNASPRGRAMRLNPQNTIQLPKPERFVNGESLTYQDLNNDGLLDILVGKGSGNIEYHQNTTSNLNPVYKRITEAYGGAAFDLIDYAKHLNITDLNGDQNLELITASNSGYIKVIPNWQNTKFKADSLLIFNDFDKKQTFAKLGGNLSLATGDLDGDGLPDVILGGRTGGLIVLKNTSNKLTPPANIQSSLIVFPNPASDFVYVKTALEGELILLNTLGQTIQKQQVREKNIENIFEFSNIASGTYIVQFIGNDGSKTSQKIVINR
jgi:Secretion system C-terminal sorting domain/FG-GAP-like repeat